VNFVRFEVESEKILKLVSFGSYFFFLMLIASNDRQLIGSTYKHGIRGPLLNPLNADFLIHRKETTNSTGDRCSKTKSQIRWRLKTRTKRGACTCQDNASGRGLKRVQRGTEGLRLDDGAPSFKLQRLRNIYIALFQSFTARLRDWKTISKNARKLGK